MLPPEGSILPRSALRSRSPFRLPALLSLVLGALVVLTVSAPGRASTEGVRPPASVGEALAMGLPYESLHANAAAVSTPLDDETEEDQEPADPRPAPFAQIDDLVLRLPSTESVVHGFHEASWSGALAMTPVGEATRVLPSRGRPNPATSAVDIVLREDDPVLSPVTGTIEKTERYRLYDKHGDRKVTIIPDEAPHLRVILIHIGGLRVEAGDRVEAGIDRIAARARLFPFRSQIDAWTAPKAYPHVHIEVTRAG